MIVKKKQNLLEELSDKKCKEIVHFLEQAGNLKTTLRFGSSLKEQEPTASHSWRVALMVFLLADEMNIQVDITKAIKLALVHDLAEAITGDIDAVDIMQKKILKEEKRMMEQQAIEKLTNNFSFGKTIKHLWDEYEQQHTAEAQLVKAIDKIEAFLHIKEAGHKQYTPKVFVHSYADPSVKRVPKLLGLLNVVKQQLKQEFSKGNVIWRG